MRTNDAGIEIIKLSEELRLEWYICPAGKLTIGYGHTSGVYEGMKITTEIAENLLREDLQKFENQLNSLNLNLNENQFSALVCFIYNVGFGNFRNSTLKAKVANNPNDKSIADEFKKWNKAGGKVMNGLITRRAMESNLYFT